MMSALLVAALLSQADPGLVQLDTQPLDVRVVQKGDLTPEKGCWMDEHTCLATAKARADLEAQNDLLLKKIDEGQTFPWVPVLIAILVGGAAGYGAAKLAK